MSKTPQRRYVKFMFSGYAPVDLAIQLHLIGKNTDINMVGEDMKPYTEYLKEYDKLYQSTKEKELTPEEYNNIIIKMRQNND